MSELRSLPNLGPFIVDQLYEVGILSGEDLKDVGAKQAWLKIQQIDESACIHRLYSLEAAIQGIKKKDLPQNIKDELKEFYNEHKK
ncbi:TfoX/Sxy family protein [Amedibacillus sp. YH-ame10]